MVGELPRTAPDSVVQTDADASVEIGWNAILSARRNGGICTNWPEGAPRWLRDLYFDLARGAFVVGHLGQSLDGFIATDDGKSFYVTGPENLDHMHRMRALADAVLVGARTVAQDDPRLTTRRVSGDNPVRVVLDPDRRLDPRHRLFVDGEAPVIVVCRQDLLKGGPARGVELVGVRARPEGFDPRDVIEALDRRGIRRIFIEGGGITVSRFLAAGALDRLQIAVAPLIVGAGRRGITLPPAASLAHAFRASGRTYAMGCDVLFDLDLRTA